MTQSKASKTSIDAKGYINGKVGEMKEKFRKTQDESARKELIETFRETTSSDEYQEQLKIVNEDARSIRKGLKPWDRTPENFEKAKEDFYGKLNTYLSSEEIREFVEKDMYEQIDFLFKKFGDGDRTLSIILNLADGGEMPYSANVNRDGSRTHYRNTDYEERMFRVGVHNKFHNISSKVANEVLGQMPFDGLILHDPNAFAEEVWKDPKVIKYIIWTLFDKRVFDWSYSDKNRGVIFKNIGDEGMNEILKHVNSRGLYKLKYFYDSCSTDYIENYIDAAVNKSNESDLRSFITSLSYYMGDNFQHFQKKFADSLINAGHIELLKKNIKYFTGLTDEEKSEISGRDLDREKFDRNLAELQELGAKLGKRIVVTDMQDEAKDEAIEEQKDEPVDEEPKKRRRWSRRK